MAFIGFILLMLGFLIAFVGSIWMLILAFMDNILWGLAYIFVPFAGLVFIILKWNKASIRRSFFLQVGGGVLSLLGFGISFNSANRYAANNPQMVSSRYSQSSTKLSRSQSQLTYSSQTSPQRTTTQYIQPKVNIRPTYQPNQSLPLTAPKASVPASETSYDRGINSALSAISISQSAASKDDWVLVASRWQKAIALMKAEPSSSRNYTLAQKKMVEYQRHLANAQQKSNSLSP